MLIIPLCHQSTHSPANVWPTDNWWVCRHPYDHTCRAWLSPVQHSPFRCWSRSPFPSFSRWCPQTTTGVDRKHTTTQHSQSNASTCRPWIGVRCWASGPWWPQPRPSWGGPCALTPDLLTLRPSHRYKRTHPRWDTEVPSVGPSGLRQRGSTWPIVVVMNS